MPSFFNVSTTRKSFILKGNLAKNCNSDFVPKNAHFNFCYVPPLKNIRFIHAFSSDHHPNLRAKNERRKIEVVMAHYQIRGVCLTTMWRSIKTTLECSRHLIMYVFLLKWEVVLRWSCALAAYFSTRRADGDMRSRATASQRCRVASKWGPCILYKIDIYTGIARGSYMKFIY